MNLDINRSVETSKDIIPTESEQDNCEPSYVTEKLGTVSEVCTTSEDFLEHLGEFGIKVTESVLASRDNTENPVELSKRELLELVPNLDKYEIFLITNESRKWNVRFECGDVYATKIRPSVPDISVGFTEQCDISLSNSLLPSVLAPTPGHTLTIDGTNYTNLSDLPLGLLINLLPSDVSLDEVVFMPDVNPGKSPLPTGTAVLTSNPNWRKLAISDCGCGMQLVKTNLNYSEFMENLAAWDRLGQLLKRNKGSLGDLGGGNHFVDALVSYDDDERVSILIHTGSRLESCLVDHLVNIPGEFEDEFARIIGWAKSNRDTVREAVEKVYGNTELVVDLHHNSFEKLDSGKVLIRKGVVKAEEGGFTILPSHMTGDVSLLRCTSRVKNTLNSLAHGTGRSMSRSDAKTLPVDFSALRRTIYIPAYIENESIKTEAPHVYRSLDRCLELLGDLVREEERFAVVGYLGRL